MWICLSPVWLLKRKDKKVCCTWSHIRYITPVKANAFRHSYWTRDCFNISPAASSLGVFHSWLAGYSNKNEASMIFLWNSTEYKSYTLSQFPGEEWVYVQWNLICGYFMQTNRAVLSWKKTITGLWAFCHHFLKFMRESWVNNSLIFSIKSFLLFCQLSEKDTAANQPF